MFHIIHHNNIISQRKEYYFFIRISGYHELDLMDTYTTMDNYYKITESLKFDHKKAERRKSFHSLNFTDINFFSSNSV